MFDSIFIHVLFDFFVDVVKLTVRGYLSQSRGKLINTFTWLLHSLPELKYLIVNILLWRKIGIELFLGGLVGRKGFQKFLGLLGQLGRGEVLSFVYHR